MLKITLIFLILTSASFAAFAQEGESKCFENDTLEGVNVVDLTISGEKVSGTFAVKNHLDPSSSKKYEFSGTLAGSRLKVQFYKNELPDVTPSVLKGLDWRLLKIAFGEEVLRIKVHGKNKDTNRYADYESCEPDYAVLKKKARAVRFARGKTSAIMPLSIKDTRERKVFSIYIRQGQSLDIDAGSCSIAVYQPDGTPYLFEEGGNMDGYKKTFTRTTIDEAGVEPIPQTGSYLVVLQKLSENSPVESVTFKITN